ncbi:MAG TPA: ATP-binding protein, partial [Pyrinomonadaceae bacterium]|nr:ATP-binding protein [Pyrinomonadaceae bacterium]
NGDGVTIGASTIAHDISERKRVEAALRESEERYRAFVANSSEAIWRFELEEPLPVDLPVEEQIEHFYKHGYLAECNDAMAAMYGFVSADEIVGARLSDLLVPDDPANVAYLRAFITSGYSTTEAESHEVDREGNPKYFLNNLVGIIRDGKLLLAWGTQRDVTERWHAERERERMLERERFLRAEAEEANRTKDEFLATLSHELRTPLTAMLGWTKMLRMKELDEATAARALETVERNAKAQAQLIEDLLDVSRIITGKLRLDVRPVELLSIIEAAMDAVQPAANAKTIKLEASLDPGAGPVSGDAARLQQIVWNLISNAVKFTPRGGHVSLQLGRADSHAEITISDTGQGITADFLPFVFDRFRQADSSTTRAHGGLGLGLAIVRHLVELHGGTVRAESRGEGSGATFIVALPLAPVYQKTHTDERVPLENLSSPLAPDYPENLEGLKILAVDDEADTRELLRTVLTECGAEVETAASAREALERMEEFRPDVLISDIGMPNEDGYDLMRRVRGLPRERGGQVPAIALTAYARAEDRLRVLRAGFQMHVPKPVELAELVAVVSSLVERREHRSTRTIRH